MEPRTPDGESSPAQHRVLVRYSGDLSTKAPATRRRFQQRLVKNLKDALSSEGLRPHVERTHDRIFAFVEKPEQITTLSRVFGVQSLSLVEMHLMRELPEIVSKGHELFRAAVRGRKFAVRARRVGDRSRILCDAREVERALGTALLPDAAGVDLDHPEVTARIEIAPGRAYFFRESLPGPGGLPLGVEGRALALVSGGFDSAVAAWQLMKRGVALDYVFCNLGGRSHQLGTLRVIKEIANRWSYGARPRFHAVDFDGVSRDLQSSTTVRYWQVLLKRLMLRAAERVAGESRSLALVTGEAMGQVSSQTLQNLTVISAATSLPILRPLIGFNKDEIIAVARKIGTYDLSRVVGEYCALVPSKPATAAALDAVLAEEARLEPELIERAVRERSVFDIRVLDLAKLEMPGLQTSTIADGATLIDLRTKQTYRAWHYPDALFLEFSEALRAYQSFDRGKSYVLYCEFGLKSAHLAELMRKAGFDAAHFKEGLSELVAYARAQGVATPKDR
jgi:thiamine biosynthesis protein ThiI